MIVLVFLVSLHLQTIFEHSLHVLFLFSWHIYTPASLNALFLPVSLAICLLKQFLIYCILLKMT